MLPGQSKVTFEVNPSEVGIMNIIKEASCYTIESTWAFVKSVTHLYSKSRGDDYNAESGR